MTTYVVHLYTPHAGQVSIHRSKARYKVVCCGRRFGKTSCGCNEQWSKALNIAGILCWWVAPVYRQAKIAYRLALKTLGPVIEHKSDTDLRIELKNGSILEYRSCDKPDNLRGEGIHHLVVEEAAMLPDDVWFKVLRPMLSDTEGEAMFISTPKGLNWFFTLFQRGLDPLKPEYESFQKPTSANPHINPKELEAAKEDMPEEVYQQEFEAEFLEDGAGAFRGVDACISGQLEEPREGIEYTLGYDVAKYNDFSVMAVFNTQTRHLDAYYRTNGMNYVEQVQELGGLAYRYNQAHILMDCTGVGEAVMDMARAVYPELSIDGYLYTNTSKTALIGDLIVGIQHQDLSYPNIPILIGELKTMQRKYTASRLVRYEAPEGGTDDFINAFGLSYHAGKSAGGVAIAITGAGKQAVALPVRHDTSDKQIQEAQDRTARVLSQLAGRFGGGGWS